MIISLLPSPFDHFSTPVRPPFVSRRGGYGGGAKVEIDWLFVGKDVQTYGLRKDTERRLYRHITEESRRITREEASGQSGRCVWYRYDRAKMDQYTVRRQRKYRVHVPLVFYQLFHGLVLPNGGYEATFSHTCPGKHADLLDDSTCYICVNPWHLHVEGSHQTPEEPLPRLGKRIRTGSAVENHQALLIETHTQRTDVDSESEDESDSGSDSSWSGSEYEFHIENGQRKRRKKKRRKQVYHAARCERQYRFWDRVLGSTCSQTVEEERWARQLNQKREQEAYRTLGDYRYGQTHLGRMLAPPRRIPGIDLASERSIIREMQTRSAELEEMTPQQVLFYIPPVIKGTYIFRENRIAAMRTFLDREGINTQENRNDALRSLLERRDELPVPESFRAYTDAELFALTDDERQHLEDERYVRYPLGSRASYDLIRAQCLPMTEAEQRAAEEKARRPRKRVRFAV